MYLRVTAFTKQNKYNTYSKRDYIDYNIDMVIIQFCCVPKSL